MKKNIFAFCLSCFFLMAYTANATENASQFKILDIAADSAIPRVFVLGQYDGVPFERMKADYNTTLMAACKNDIETAYFCWVSMLQHMETHSKKMNFDLNGIKLWMYVFYEKDGAISYIAYHPKPNSKNFKQEDMTAFLNSFCSSYTFPLKSDKPFSNYSTATFPVMVEKPKSSGGDELKPANGSANLENPKAGSNNSSKKNTRDKRRH